MNDWSESLQGGCSVKGVSAFEEAIRGRVRSGFVGGLVFALAYFVAASVPVNGQGLAFSRADTVVGVGAVIVQDNGGIWPGASLAVALNGTAYVEGIIHRTSSNVRRSLDRQFSLMGRRMGVRVSGDVVKQSKSFPLTLGFSADLAIF